jgi:hypothetical protein
LIFAFGLVGHRHTSACHHDDASFSSVYSSVANTFWPAPGVRASAPSGNTPHSSLRTRIRIINAECNALWFFSPAIAACSFSGSKRCVLPSSWFRSISAVYTFPQALISMRQPGISFFQALIRRSKGTPPIYLFKPHRSFSFLALARILPDLVLHLATPADQTICLSSTPGLPLARPHIKILDASTHFIHE